MYRLNYDRTIVHLQTDLRNIGLNKDISPFITREMNYDSEEELIQWAEIVNDAYDDGGKYDLEYAKNHLNNHLFLKTTNVYLVFDGVKPIGTISIGVYKENPKIGGAVRLAVRKDYQGYGIGKYLHLYGFVKLREKGFYYIESILTITREQSMRMNFSYGFVPQFNRKFISYKGQKRYAIVRFLVNRNLKKQYKKYLLEVSEKFLK